MQALEEEKRELAGALQAAAQDRTELKERLSRAESSASSPR